MTTIGEALESALAVQESRLVLKGWEASILTVLVWNPHSLHLFIDRLRPEVLKLAHDIVHALECNCTDEPSSPEAQAFIDDVNRMWPHDEQGRRRWNV